jgi:uncharacterized protein
VESDARLLDARLAALDADLRTVDGLLVAFSGGADSAFLLAAAVRALGPQRVVAATAVSPSLAATSCRPPGPSPPGLGVRHLTPTTDELSREGYVANGADRCFHCKATLVDTLRPLAASLGLAAVATGTNADDAVAASGRGSAPPPSGERARRCWTPACPRRRCAPPAAGGGSSRPTSRRWPAWPAASRTACRSRPPASARVDRAERALRSHLGQVVDLRVRDLGEGRARVELDPAALARADEQALDVVRAEGFDEVTAREFRSGSMNAALSAQPG